MNAEEKIQDFIEEEINPGLASHGGYLNVQRFDIKEGLLYVVMGGGCQGCASAKQTMGRPPWRNQPILFKRVGSFNINND